MKKLLVVLLVLFVSFLGDCLADEYYSYVSIDGRMDLSDDHKTNVRISQSNVSINEKERIILYNDFGMQFKTCKSKKWFCIYSDKLNFAIEKNWQPTKSKKWSESNFEFILLKEIEDSYGEKIFIIKVTAAPISKTDPSIVFYSKSKGVVGFVFYYIKQNVSKTYWLMDPKGFGSP